MSSLLIRTSSRSLLLSSRRSLTTSTSRLSKLTEQKYDEAELMSDKLNKAPYYAKRPQTDIDAMFQQEDPDRAATPAELERYKRLEALKGLATGVLMLVGIFGAFTAYQKWPAIQGWWNKTDEDREFESPKKVKKVLELPVLTNPNSSDVPGLYLCGDNSNWTVHQDKKMSESKFPLRFDWFDGKILKDVALGEQSAVAVDSKGDLIQWGRGFNNDNVPKYTVKGQKLVKARISNGVIYALKESGEILTIPESDKQQEDTPGLAKRTWLFQKFETNYNKISNEELSKGEKIVDIQTGDEHLLALSNKGKAYSTSTGLVAPTKSKGQFGIPQYSQFNSPPSPHKLHEITILNQAVSKTSKGKIDHVEDRQITKIAAGAFHSLALDSNGELYTFGKNTYGQLAHPVNYNSEIIALPKKVDLIAKHIKRDMFGKVTDIQAGGDTSFCTVSPVPLYRLINSNVVEDENKDDGFVVGFGNNLKGQIGTGHYVHAQFDPIKIKELAKFEDYNEQTKEIEKIHIKSWYVGREHTFVKLENGDVLYWGSNDYGQLGNGKKTRVAKPSTPPRLIEPDYTNETYKDLTFVNRLQLKDNQEIATGSNATAVYYTDKR